MDTRTFENINSVVRDVSDGRLVPSEIGRTTTGVFVRLQAAEGLQPDDEAIVDDVLAQILPAEWTLRIMHTDGSEHIKPFKERDVSESAGNF